MEDKKKAIVEALKTLDPANDEHWTAEGAPRLDALKIEGIKRADVVEAAPHFKRDNLNIATPHQKLTEKQKEKAAEEADKAERDVINLLDAEVEKTRKLLTDLEIQGQELARKIASARGAHDDAVRKYEAVVGRRGEQADIMDYLASRQMRVNQRVEEALKAKG